MMIIPIVYFTILSQLLALLRLVQSPPKFQPEIEHEICQKRFLSLPGRDSFIKAYTTVSWIFYTM